MLLINQTRLINYLQVCGDVQSWVARDTALVAKDMQAFYQKKSTRMWERTSQMQKGYGRKHTVCWSPTHCPAETVLENAQEKKGENVANARRNPNLW